jgi:hypothetical protein
MYDVLLDKLNMLWEAMGKEVWKQQKYKSKSETMTSRAEVTIMH